jgi:hypothetical protein
MLYPLEERNLSSCVQKRKGRKGERVELSLSSAFLRITFKVVSARGLHHKVTISHFVFG